VKPDNRDESTIASFGDEWSTFTQEALSREELEAIFWRYFAIFPWDTLPAGATGFDMGCGSGRWASFVAPRVGRLHCIDPSPEALMVARRNLAAARNVEFHNDSTESVSLEPGSCDFGYSLGVLHHIPDTERALADCVRLLKPGAPFLLYLYYRFDNRPAWFRGLWHCSNLVRQGVSVLPPLPKRLVTDGIAIGVYWPLSRVSRLLERAGVDVAAIPLSFYRDASIHTLRTDSRDRFGTPLERRFTRAEMAAMMERAGLRDIRFSETEPFWCAVGRRAAGSP